MNNNYLNIIALNIPYPADYGGVIDIFNKIKTLHQLGIKIHLHCFKYGRREANELLDYCESVKYYKRKRGIKFFLKTKPYIVATRVSTDLLHNLCANNYPILFDGLHTTYYINHPKLTNRKKIIRSHNIEHDYYYRLAKSEKNLFEKIYLYTEAIKLKKYFSIFSKANYILSISKNDHNFLSNHFSNVIYIPAFHSNDSVQIKNGKGLYILYHGNLSVAENIEAAIFLIKKVFSKIEYKVIIAGKNPPDHFKKLIKQYKTIQLFPNPDKLQLEQLIQDAQINLLVSFQGTGLKLKLLNALYIGRHCLVNPTLVFNTGLEQLCTIAESPKEMMDRITQLMNIIFSTEQIESRRQILDKYFSNIKTAKKIIELL